MTQHCGCWTTRTPIWSGRGSGSRTGWESSRLRSHWREPEQQRRHRRTSWLNGCGNRFKSEKSTAKVRVATEPAAPGKKLKSHRHFARAAASSEAAGGEPPFSKQQKHTHPTEHAIIGPQETRKQSVRQRKERFIGEKGRDLFPHVSERQNSTVNAKPSRDLMLNIGRQADRS